MRTFPLGAACLTLLLAAACAAPLALGHQGSSCILLPIKAPGDDGFTWTRANAFSSQGALAFIQLHRDLHGSSDVKSHEVRPSATWDPVRVHFRTPDAWILSVQMQPSWNPVGGVRTGPVDLDVRADLLLGDRYNGTAHHTLRIEDTTVGTGSGTSPARTIDFMFSVDADGFSSSDITTRLTFELLGNSVTPTPGDALIKLNLSSTPATGFATLATGPTRLVVPGGCSEPKVMPPMAARAPPGTFEEAGTVVDSTTTGPGPLSALGWGPAVAGALVAALASYLVAPAAAKSWLLRRVLGILLAVGLFSRVNQGTAADNPRRSLILGYLQANGGARFYQMRHDLEMSHGTLLHHLNVLASVGLIVLEREGRQLTARLPHQRVVRLPPIEAQELLSQLAAAPGSTVKELAERLGWSRRKTSYWVNLLLVKGQLRDGWRGRAHTLAPVPVTTPA